jgi:O-antigen/teichoic acid export membrane protein
MAILFPRLLDQSVLGLIQVLIAAMIFISNLGSLGLQFIVVRFYPIFRQKGISTRTFFSFSFLIAIVSMTLIIVGLWLLEKDLKEFYSVRAELFADYYFLMYPLAVFGTLSILLDSWSRAIMKSALTAQNKEITTRILQLMAVLIFAYDLIDLSTFLWAYTAIQAIYVGTMFVAITKYSKIGFSFDFSKVKKSLVADVAKFGAVSSFSTTTFLANNSDILLVGSFVGLKATAVYGVASSIAKVIAVPSRSLTRVATSVIADAWSTDDLGRIQRIYYKSAINNLIVTGAFFLLVIFVTPFFLSLIPDSYAGAQPVIVILAFSKLIHTATGINGGIIASSKDYWLNMVNNTLAFLLLVVLTYIFIDVYGMIGAAYASVVVVSLSNIVRYAFLKIKYGMGPFSPQYLYVASLLGALYFVSEMIPNNENLLVDAALRVLLGMSAFLIPVYVLNWSTDFTEALDLGIKKIRRYMGKSKG